MKHAITMSIALLFVTVISAQTTTGNVKDETKKNINDSLTKKVTDKTSGAAGKVLDKALDPGSWFKKKKKDGMTVQTDAVNKTVIEVSNAEFMELKNFSDSVSKRKIVKSVTKKYNSVISQVEVEHLGSTDQLLESLLGMTGFKIDIKEFEAGKILISLKK